MAGENGGLISGGYNPLEAPDAPTSVSGSGGDESIDVSFTAPSDVGGAAIDTYIAVATASGETTAAEGASSPVTISGLTNGTAYSISAYAKNTYGYSPVGLGGNVTPAAPIALFTGFAFNSTQIDSVEFATLGNASDYGDLSEARNRFGAGCSGTRAVFMGGGGFSGGVNTIDYVTVSAGGTASDFGDMYAGIVGNGVCSNTTRAVSAGQGSTSENTISYITIATTGNTSDFGDTLVGFEYCGACGSSTRGLWGGGNGYINNINYVTIASTGNASDFGDLTVARENVAAASNSTRGIFGGGKNPSGINVIEYVTIASTGNATDFGDLLNTVDDRGGMAANSTRCLFASGDGDNVIQYVTIASTGNAVDFGDTTVTGNGVAGTSSAHGGLS